MTSAPIALSLLAALLLATPAGAQWSFDETTTGGDLHWVSPGSVDPAAFAYDVAFQITVVEVGIELGGIPLGTIDVTADVPPEDLGGLSNVAGPAPIVFADIPVVVPEPPEPPSVAGTLTTGIDATGFAFLDFTDVVLGTFTTDLGFPFGVVTVDIVSLRIAGTLDIDATRWLDLGSGLDGSAGTPVLAGSGTLAGGDPLALDLSGALGSTTAWLTVGIATLDAPFKGGVLVPDINPPGFVVALFTDPSGAIEIDAVWPVGFPPDFDTFYQYWIQDGAGPVGFAASNAVQGRTP